VHCTAWPRPPGKSPEHTWVPGLNKNLKEVPKKSRAYVGTRTQQKPERSPKNTRALGLNKNLNEVPSIYEHQDLKKYQEEVSNLHEH
jgi:hypothetical protein